MPKALPERLYGFVVADGIRQEFGGKMTIVGAYSAGAIILDKSSKFPAVMPLSLLVTFKDGEGTFNGKLQIFDPSGKPTIPPHPLGQLTKQADQGMQLALNFPMMPLPSVGTYKVQVTLDERVYEDTFSVRVGEISQTGARVA